MNFDYSEADEYDADFAEMGEVEFEELEMDDVSAEIAQLAAAVHGARAWH